MRKEDRVLRENRIVNYRPELAEQLQKCVEFAKTLYSVNYQRMYYELLAETCKETDPEQSELLYKVADCFDGSVSGAELFYDEYKDELKKYNIEHVSSARAAYVVYRVFGPELDKLKENIDTKDLTKMEKFMIDNFFKKLKMPMCNPNIEIKEGETKCYYDKTPHASFDRDLKSSVKYLERECQDMIDIFNTPDEPELDVADDNEDIEIGE